MAICVVLLAVNNHKWSSINQSINLNLNAANSQWDPTFPPWAALGDSGEKKNCLLSGRNLEQNRTQWLEVICLNRRVVLQCNEMCGWPLTVVGVESSSWLLVFLDVSKTFASLINNTVEELYQGKVGVKWYGESVLFPWLFTTPLSSSPQENEPRLSGSSGKISGLLGWKHSSYCVQTWLWLIWK